MCYLFNVCRFLVKFFVLPKNAQNSCRASVLSVPPTIRRVPTVRKCKAKYFRHYGAKPGINCATCHIAVPSNACIWPGWESQSKQTNAIGQSRWGHSTSHT